MSMEQVAVGMDGLSWFKSSYSGSDGGDCVEIATSSTTIHVRDSKTTENGPVLRVGHDQWNAFLALATT
ncbi:DUF397 domain-containing protein [Streptomyces sp. NPDC046887]|uniref:DUF397 domain-containing protein n=1 Tax=Streptomyces sp. NPDC046887 TaxID=3155472 RepID=UPI0033F935B1